MLGFTIDVLIAIYGDEYGEIYLFEWIVQRYFSSFLCGAYPVKQAVDSRIDSRHISIMRNRFGLTLLLTIALTTACRESGHDPGRTLYEHQLLQRRQLLHLTDSLFDDVFAHPLEVERGIGDLYRSAEGAQLRALSEDQAFNAEITYLRRALAFALRLRKLENQLAKTTYDRFQTMIFLPKGSYGPQDESPATDPTVLVHELETLRADAEDFLTKEVISYKYRNPKKEATIRERIDSKGIKFLENALSSYSSFTGRESELEGTSWQQQAYQRRDNPDDYDRALYTPQGVFAGKISFGKDHKLYLDSLQLPTSYYSFPYGYSPAEIFKDFEGRGRGQDNSIFAVKEGPFEAEGMRYYFGQKYLTLVLPTRPSSFPRSKRYTIAITMEYQRGRFTSSPKTLLPRYERGPNSAGVESDLDPWFFYSIFDRSKHWGTIRVRNAAPSYVWAGPVSFVPSTQP